MVRRYTGVPHGALTVRVHGPSLVMRIALEHDVEKNDQVCDGESSKRDIVYDDQS